MTPQRFHPLHSIYKNLCITLNQAMLRLYTTDFTKPEAEETKKCIENILVLFEYQTALEESILFSSIHDYEPFVTAILRDDHRQRRKQICALQAFLAEYSSTNDASILTSLAAKFIYKFNDFLLLCIEQMRSHETLVASVLWRYYSDDELQLISISLQGSFASYQHKVAA